MVGKYCRPHALSMTTYSFHPSHKGSGIELKMMYYVITPVQVKLRADTFRKILIMNNFQNQSHFLQTFIANKHVKKGSAVLKRVVEQALF